MSPAMTKIILPPEIQEADNDASSREEEIVDSPIEQQRKELSFREERWHYYTRILFLGIASFCTASVVLVFLFHLVAPESWRWLGADEVSRIRELAVAIIVGLVMSWTTSYFFKRKL